MIFDIVIFLLMAFFAFAGMYAGFIKISINLISLVTAIIASYYIYPVIESAIGGKVSQKSHLALISIMISYFVGLLCYVVLNGRMIAFCQDIRGGFADRVLGVFASLVTGGVVCALLFLLITGISIYNKDKKSFSIKNFTSMPLKSYPKWLQDSTAGPILHGWTTGGLEIAGIGAPNDDEMMEEEAEESIPEPTEDGEDLMDDFAPSQ